MKITLSVTTSSGGEKINLQIIEPVMSNTVRVACGQLCSSSNLLSNANIVKKLIRKAVTAKAKVLFLPEATDYIAKDATQSMQLAQTSHESFISILQKELRDLYADNGAGLYVAVGVHEPSSSIGVNAKENLKKVLNNQLWIDNKGEILHRYQKLHLFDINIENGPILKESNSVEPGNSVLKPFPINSTSLSEFIIGFATCYDIRFPELGLRLRRLGANIITYPSAFTTKTGQAHWELLGRARAVDTQCYVVMAAQCGEHNTEGDKKRISYGNSIIIDPWGNKISECRKYDDELSLDADGDYYEMCVADLDIDIVKKTRRDMPLMTHRRPDVFGYEV
ncbi:uncharacterized protein AC631_03118 [Debaryomyces fabryi]|uniref:CN hydrolase domain-containing protein n=1 Tax=Debaryomyces fabryi TaxID=58627 RepID=A0A0V1PXZ6_9ASCO|nr:uncharacterized protein AC631_03118 [Debaryomyces fabryi]KSA01113.1 hypothetical protein AC631_03118 [Debaryomyces fabryi]CUM55500.1 unnamed protein product [Debaryomyces fabryi]